MNQLSFGKESDTVEGIQRMLNTLGYPHKVEPGEGGLRFQALTEDGEYGIQTRAVILDFQESEGLLRDGIVGPVTMAALENAYMARIQELNVPGIASVDGMPDRFVFVSVPGDKYLSSYERIYLRSDAASAYLKVYDRTREAGGTLALSAGLRSLRVKGSPSRSVHSFHHLGLAFDLYYFGGMQDPETDPFVIHREAEHKYRVYLRCSPERAGGDALPEESTLSNAITYGNRKEGVEVKGHFLDLTRLLADQGFKPIEARPGFEEGTSVLKAEWWHFQFERPLTAHASSFGAELLRVYSEDTLRDTAPWQYRHHIFKKNWF